MRTIRTWLDAQLADLTLAKAFSFLMCVLAAGYIAYSAIYPPTTVLPFLALTGALVGWVVGILATPLSSAEEGRFGELAKVISGFVSGYLLSKIDPLIGHLLGPADPKQAAIMNTQVALDVLITLSAFFMALLFVVGGRLYWTTPNDVSQRDRPAKNRTRPSARRGGATPKGPKRAASAG